jgi:microsomal epoxide hydrolase
MQWPFTDESNQLFSGPRTHSDPDLHLEKPLAYSNFARETQQVPQSWVATTGDLVYYKHHEKGGHFAALEVPRVLANDIVEFVRSAWRN